MQNQLQGLRTSLWILSLLLSTSLVACSERLSSPTAEPDPSTAQEQTGGVVALTSLTADMIYQLDQTKLVGRPGSRLIDQDPRFQDIPAVSQGRTPPNLEQVVALKPQLVVGAAGFHDQVLKKLEDLGIATLATDIDNWQSMIDLTETLATKIQADPAPLLTRYQVCETQPSDPKPTTLVLVSQQPILAPNKTSWAGDLLQRFGAKNLVADLQGDSPVGGYVTLSAEKVLAANPEVMLVVDPEKNALESFKTAPFWNQLSATQNNQVYPFDYYGLVNPGSIDKILQTCSQLKQALQ